MRLLVKGRETVQDYMHRDWNIFLRLIGVQEDELHNNLILGLSPEMKQRLKYRKAEKLRDLLEAAMQWLDIKGSREDKGMAVYTSYEVCA